MKRILEVLCLTLFVVFGLGAPRWAMGNAMDNCLACPNTFTRRYVMFGCNLRTKSQEERSKRLALLSRVKKSGYNAIVHYNDLMVVSRNSKTWFDNFRELTSEAKRLGLAQGMYDGAQKHPSYHDLNVSEAFPTLGTRYVIEAGRGRLVSDHAVRALNSGFESFTGNGHVPDNWKPQGLAIGTHLFADHTIRHSGKSSVRIVTPKYPAALTQRIRVKPHRAYRLSVWIKTQNYDKSKSTSLAVMGSRNMWLLHITEPDPFGWGQYAVAANQNWKKSIIDFNSMNNEQVTIHIYPTQYWGQANGTIWFDDFSIEEVGLYEAVKRSSAPVKVVSEGTGAIYKENTDYTLEIGAKFNYQGKLKIPSGSAIKDGDTVRVDWYQLANVDYFRIPDAVGCIPEYYEYLEKDVRAVHEILNPLQIVFAQLGEWRVGFWDPTCIAKHKTAGIYMAATAMRTRDLLRRVNPQMEVGFKNDMFDPFHNQLANPYYMTNGSMRGSDLGITQDVSMSNWIFATSGDSGTALYNSTLFWGGMHPSYPRKLTRQLLRVNADGKSSDLPFRLEVLKKLETKGLRGVNGVLYNTWYHDYTTLETVADQCRQAGRWANNPWAPDACQLKLYDSSTRQKPALRKPQLSLMASTKSQRAIVSYSLPRASRVKARLFTAQGRIRRQVDVTRQSAGNHQLSWNVSGLSPGVYFLRITAHLADESGGQGHANCKLAILE